MRNRKRSLALVLALALCLGLAAPALAADGDAGVTQVTHESGITYYLSNPVLAVLDMDDHWDTPGPVYVIPWGTQISWSQGAYWNGVFDWDVSYWPMLYNGRHWLGGGSGRDAKAPHNVPYSGLFFMMNERPELPSDPNGEGDSGGDQGSEQNRIYFLMSPDNGEHFVPTENIMADMSQPSLMYLNNVLARSTVTIDGVTLPLYDIPADSGVWKDFGGIDGTFAYYTVTEENGQLTVGEQHSFYDTRTSVLGASSGYGTWMDESDVDKYYFVECFQEPPYSGDDDGSVPDPVRFVLHCVDPSRVTATAYASTQEVDVDGEKVTFQCYALKDANGYLTNYIKLRDLAMLLNGTAAQFQVGWDGSIAITTKTAYTPNGSEGSTPYWGDRGYTENDAVTTVDGAVAELSSFVLHDDVGGGYAYYQLRDLARLLGFNVGWNGSSIFVETDKPYDANN